jgi:hypothetical protein
MREKFYGLLREYIVTLRERDLCEEQFQAAPEGIEREQASCKRELTQKRCVALRREIKRYPDINALPRATAPNNPPRRYTAQAS